jgi:cyanophycinase
VGTGELLVIGGAERRGRDPGAILRRVADRARPGGLLLVTAAAEDPAAAARDYQEAFGALGVRMDVLDIRDREGACRPENVEKLRRCAAVFLSGGDQVRMTSQLGGTPVLDALRDCHARGVLVAGTSAGAAVMPETMLVAGGPDDQSLQADEIDMAPGFGLLDGAIVCVHFAERGRMGLLVAAVARNPDRIGLGIDEDTAVSHADGMVEVIGSRSVYVLDAHGSTWSSLAAEPRSGMTRIHDLRVHVLADGDRFDLRARRPLAPLTSAARPSPTSRA